MEQLENKKKTILIYFLILILLILMLGVSYAFWQTTRVQEDNNIVASGCFGVELVGNNPISLSNTYPITKEEGMKTTPYTFTITNICENDALYDVNLEALSNTNFQNESIRVALDGINKLYSEYEETEKYYEESKDSRTLISGTLENGASITYNLRVWIDEKTPNSEQNKTFESKIIIMTGKSSKRLADKVKLGDYIQMTPTSTSYTLPNDLSGCDGTEITCVQNEINPSELNLWRVIKKNEDGTVDAVSDKVSSEIVYFYGKTGYINFIKGLNEIAAQYTNGKNVARTRHIGYSTQTEVLTDSSMIDKISAPWTESTSQYDQWTGCDSNYFLCGLDEAVGAGDIGYEMDYNLVNATYGSMVSNDPNGNLGDYWLASRRFYYVGDNEWYFYGRCFYSNTGADDNLYNYNGSFNSKAHGRRVRPIVTFKADSIITLKDGESGSNYYVLE